MQPNLSRISILFLASVILLSSCTFLQQDRTDELDKLQEQVNALATQNALLQEQLSSSAEETLEAPPPPQGNEPGQAPVATPYPESLPTEPVPAGVPTVYNGWSMIVSKELVILDSGEAWGIEVYVKNLRDTDRVFRFINAGLTPRDDLGNIYEYLNDSSSGVSHCEAYRYEVKNLEIEADNALSIRSSYSGWWNKCDENDSFDWWTGPIPLQASQIIVLFEDFGPFDNVEVVIDL